MPGIVRPSCVFVSLGALAAGCQSAPARFADESVHTSYHAASTGVVAVRATGGEIYQGAGKAVRQPFHDLNMLQDQIAPVLLRAESHPYDLASVNSCNDVLDRVAELDLALGPDVDTPKQKHRTRVSRGADFAAEAALDAAGSAAEHFIPMRSTIRQLTGAERYDNHVKHALLAGATRRSFLKAIGMEHGCSWPAAPLDFKPAQVADASAPWSVPIAPAAARPGASVLLAKADAAPAPLAPIATAGSDGSPAVSRSAIVVATAPSPSAVFVPVRTELVVPSPDAPADPDQSWRPAAATQVVAASATTASKSAAPWSSAFVGGRTAH